MANYNLTDQPISSSFEQLLQKNTDTEQLVDGVGTTILDLTISGSTTSDFFIGDGSQLTNIPQTEIPQGTVSGSSQIDYPEISNIPSGIISGSVVTSIIAGANISIDQGTGDVTITAEANADLPSGVISGSSQVDYPEISNIPSGIVSGSSQIILQSTTGLLSGSRIDGAIANSTNSVYSQNTITTGKNLHTSTIAKGTPLFFTASGTNGNVVGVYPADAGNPARMPAGGIAGESIAVEAEGVVLLDGFINNVNTSIFQSGDEIFVGVGGGYTNVAPTGSALIQHLGNVEKSDTAGSGVIQMMGEVRGLPNLPQDNIWVGDSNGVPKTVSTGSFAKTDISNTFTGTQIFDTITANSASIGYLESVSGSAKIIGDAFIILNNNTPTERYAGLSVYDSGSLNNTSSFFYDGQTDDWFFQKQVGLDQEYGVALFGPEYTVQGSPIYLSNNTIPKGGGGHHLSDSSITDDGSTVTVSVNEVVTGTNLGPANTLDVKDGNGTSKLQVTNNTLSGFTSVDVLVVGNQKTDGNLEVTNKTTVGAGLELTGSLNSAGDATINGTNLAPSQTFTAKDGNGTARLQVNNATLAGLAGADVLVNGNLLNSGNSTLTGKSTIQGGLELTGSLNSAGDATILGTTGIPANTFQVNDGNGTPRLQVTNSTLSGLSSTDISLNGKTQITDTLTLLGDEIINGTNVAPSQTFIAKDGNGTNRLEVNNATLSGFTSVDVNINGKTQITDTLTAQNGITLNGLTTINSPVVTAVTAQGIDGGGTATIDFGQTSLFQLTLAQGVLTTIDAENVAPGMTINLLITQNGTTAGTVAFSSKFKQPDGSAYVPTTTLGGKDILTLMTFGNPTEIFVVAVNKFV